MNEIKRKKIKGTVVSDKMQKTIVVLAERYIKHPKYKKYHQVSKKFKAHDEKNEAKIGDIVMIEECRPISKDKSFKLVEVIGKTKNIVADEEESNS